jgi:hypothetical protein
VTTRVKGDEDSGLLIAGRVIHGARISQSTNMRPRTRACRVDRVAHRLKVPARNSDGLGLRRRSRRQLVSSHSRGRAGPICRDVRQLVRSVDSAKVLACNLVADADSCDFSATDVMTLHCALGSSTRPMNNSAPVERSEIANKNGRSKLTSCCADGTPLLVLNTTPVAAVAMVPCSAS